MLDYFLVFQSINYWAFSKTCNDYAFFLYEIWKSKSTISWNYFFSQGRFVTDGHNFHFLSFQNQNGNWCIVHKVIHHLQVELHFASFLFLCKHKDQLLSNWVYHLVKSLPDCWREKSSIWCRFHWVVPTILHILWYLRPIPGFSTPCLLQS